MLRLGLRRVGCSIDECAIGGSAYILLLSSLTLERPKHFLVKRNIHFLFCLLFLFFGNVKQSLKAFFFFLLHTTLFKETNINFLY